MHLNIGFHSKTNQNVFDFDAKIFEIDPRYRKKIIFEHKIPKLCNIWCIYLA